MNSDSENFEQLRRLLALKRHEQPPPGYFNGFSRQVLARIKAGEQGGQEYSPGTWFQRLWAVLESKPVFAGAFGAAVCALLITGVLNSGEAGISPAMLGSAVAPESSTALASPGSMVMNEDYSAQLASGTNSISDLFNRFQLRAEPVSMKFSLPEGN